MNAKVADKFSRPLGGQTSIYTFCGIALAVSAIIEQGGCILKSTRCGQGQIENIRLSLWVRYLVLFKIHNQLIKQETYMSDFDYGGEVAVSVSKFKNPIIGVRNARLYGLLRVGTFQESHNGTLKDPAPQGIAIFHLLGGEDKMEGGEPMFFTKQFPFKKGEKTFLHRKANGFISAFGGLDKHSGFGSMISGLFSLDLVGGKALNEDGSPKYINFGSMSEIGKDTLELLEDSPKYTALEAPVGFLTESQLTKEALEMLHPTREFAGVVMKTQEFVAGTHPSQAVIQEVFDADPERYTFKEKDDKAKPAGDQAASGVKSLPVEAEKVDAEQEF